MLSGRYLYHPGSRKRGLLLTASKQPEPSIRFTMGTEKDNKLENEMHQSELLKNS